MVSQIPSDAHCLSWLVYVADIFSVIEGLDHVHIDLIFPGHDRYPGLTVFCDSHFLHGHGDRRLVAAHLGSLLHGKPFISRNEIELLRRSHHKCLFPTFCREFQLRRVYRQFHLKRRLRVVRTAACKHEQGRKEV